MWIISHYKWADMKVMLEGSKFLETKNFGTNAARKTVRDTGKGRGREAEQASWHCVGYSVIIKVISKG